MESYKHSCPCCGQHIEYTVGYCGKQMQCPMCGQTVTFPAVPPGRPAPSLRVKSLEAKSARSWKVPKALAFLRDFQHWNVVAQCAVPFLIIAALLGGAIFVKNKLGEPSSTGEALPAVQADPQAWQRMADLTKAEQAVQAAGRVLDQANATLQYEEQARRHLNNADSLQRKDADEKVQRAQNAVNAARRQFDAAENKYRQLGGTKDYRSLLRKY
jgi:uncharacterized membrane protein